MLSAVVGFLLRNVMIALVLAVALSTTPAALRATWSERWLVGRTLLVLEIGVPLLTLAAVTLLPLSPEVTGIIALMAVCPGSPMILHKVRDRTVVVVIMAVVSLLVPLTVPTWVAVLDRLLPLSVAIPPVPLATMTLVKVMLPLVAGIAVAALLPRTARLLARVVWVAYLVAFGFAVLATLARGAPLLLRASPWALGAVMVVTLGGAAMGHWAGRPRLEDSSALARIAVLGNPALALAVVEYSYPDVESAALMSAYLLARALALIPYGRLLRRWSQSSPG